jgi:hypothetical protein
VRNPPVGSAQAEARILLRGFLHGLAGFLGGLTGSGSGVASGGGGVGSSLTSDRGGVGSAFGGGVNGGLASGSSGVAGGSSGVGSGVGSLASGGGGVSSGFLSGLDGLFLLRAAGHDEGGKGGSKCDLRVHFDIPQIQVWTICQSSANLPSPACFRVRAAVVAHEGF